MSQVVIRLWIIYDKDLKVHLEDYVLESPTSCHNLSCISKLFSGCSENPINWRAHSYIIMKQEILQST